MNRLSIFFLFAMLSGKCIVAADLPLIYEEKFENGKAENWQFFPKDNWRVLKKDNEFVFYLAKAGELGTPRRPGSYAILTPYNVGSFELIVRVNCQTNPSNEYRDMCLFFGFQDSVHFYYAHFAGRSDNVHNIIGIVNNADREKINNEPAGSSTPRMTDDEWHLLKIKRDIESGTIEGFIDDMENPILTARDKTFLCGRVGVGSFDDTGWFKDIKLYGNLMETGLGDDIMYLPVQFNLGQNYPNPFNSNTVIPVSFSQMTDIRVCVYNVLGHEMSRFALTGRQPGRYTVDFKADHLTSGVYFYRAENGENTQIKKMLLLR
ncbi:T9SS type A sorting domain-containing protein [candidate division KSB1 bacterium]|nr:T9SS type A sorting domain-containing protein [candidate division KSB1 bacterium]